jgi:hypothetical protein
LRLEDDAGPLQKRNNEQTQSEYHDRKQQNRLEFLAFHLPSTTMSSADQDEKLAQFRSLTGAPEPMARSYLEATNWDIEVPIASTRNSNR